MANLVIYKCRVTQNFTALKGGGIPKNFYSGQSIDVAEANQGNGASMMNGFFITQDGFSIPKGNVKVMGKRNMNIEPSHSNASGSDMTQYDEEIQDAVVIENKPKVVSLPNGGIIKKDFAQSLQTKSKTAVNGALVGLGAGLLYAMAKQKNKLIFSVVGSLLGMVAGGLYHKYTNEEQTVKK